MYQFCMEDNKNSCLQINSVGEMGDLFCDTEDHSAGWTYTLYTLYTYLDGKGKTASARVTLPDKDFFKFISEEVNRKQKLFLWGSTGNVKEDLDSMARMGYIGYADGKITLDKKQLSQVIEIGTGFQKDEVRHRVPLIDAYYTKIENAGAGIKKIKTP